MASGGAVIGESLALFLEACAASFCGLFPRAEAAAKRSILLARRAGAEVTHRYASLWLAFVLTRSGRADDAVRCLESLTDQLDPAQAQWRHTFLADAYRRQGALTNALSEARTATAGLLPTTTAFTLPILARVHLDLGQPEECREVAELPRSTVQPAYAADLLTSKALALRALGRDEEAAQSLATAREIVLDAARDFENPDLRSAFLTNVDENPRTLALAQKWLGEAK